MRARAKTLTIAAVALLLAALLAGCVHADAHLTINADGSADYAVDLALSDDVIKPAKAQGQDPFASSAAELKADGYEVKEISSDGYTGIHISRHFNDAGQIGSDGSLDKLNTLLGGANKNFAVKKQSGFFSTTYTVHADMDPSALLGSQFDLGEAAKVFLDKARVTMAVTLPQKAGSHNATEVSADGLTYTWQLQLDKPAAIDLSMTMTNWTNILLAGGGALVVIVLIVVIAAVAKGRRRRQAAPKMRARGR